MCGGSEGFGGGVEEVVLFGEEMGWVCDCDSGGVGCGNNWFVCGLVGGGGVVGMM